MKNKALRITAVFLLSYALAGCTVIFQSGRRSDQQKINELSAQVDELMQAKRALEERLSSEISDKQVKLQMMDKGLVITVVGDLVFDSGKAKVRPEAYNVLDKVAQILRDDVPSYNVGIEGHTDNNPIARSGWKSNWELSTARALSVLHYMVNEKGISPDRLSAAGFGEYRPVDSNDTASGRQANRRVEIVVFPQITKVKDSGKASMIEPQENLK